MKCRTFQAVACDRGVCGRFLVGLARWAWWGFWDAGCVDDGAAAAVAWLLAAPEPAVRHLTRRDLLGEDSTSDQSAIAEGPWVSALLEGQQDDGGFGQDP